jgi:hypothetical protein
MTRKIPYQKLTISSEDGKAKELLGIPALISQLEKDYFSKISISNSTVCCEKNNLVINMDSSMGLHEILFHLQQGYWGGQHFDLVDKGITSLRQCMSEIRELNATFLDVEELSIHLSDCSIVIKKISPESVEYELNAILNTLAENYVYITRQLTMTPAEIFIPVFEETPAEDELACLISNTQIDDKGYYSYWGLYFDTDEEAHIYDLKQKKIISGDLNLLNQ